MKRYLLFIVFLCALTACVQSSGRYGIDIEPPTASATHARAEVGETVTVTLKSRLGLDEDSDLANNTFSDVRFGACFVEGNPQVSSGGFCGNGNTPLQSWIVVLADEHVIGVGNVDLERGETYPLEATFTFTTTEAKDVIIHPWIYVDTTGSIGHRGGEPAWVIFE